MRYPRVDMEGLTAIVALAETGDTVKAGALLNIGPSAVTKRLSKAETELVTKFFRKTKNRVVLTRDERRSKNRPQSSALAALCGPFLLRP